MNETERANIFRKIEALREKTKTYAHATEEEAAAAAAKARELVEKYQIDLGAEAVRREGFVLRDIRLDGYTYHFASCVGYAIGRFAEVQVWFTRSSGLPATAWILGLRSDVELAAHLFESLSTQALAGAAKVPSKDRHGFVVGAATGISQRLLKQVHTREAQVAGGGRALVPIDKGTLVQNELDARGIKIQRGGGVRTSNAAAFDAGADHGARVGFGRPIANSGRVAGLIEHKGRRS
jgi:hypothetical protein